MMLLQLIPARLNAQTQITFCPTGATWSSAFLQIPMWNGVYSYINEKIVYAGDTLMGGTPVKILNHRFYYTTCYNSGFGQIKRTFIKQNGDTVFFRNVRTQDTWQILYDFGSVANSYWTTNVLKANGTFVPYITSIDSVKTVIENGFNLKRMYSGSRTITERYGDQGFIFRFLSYAPGCDGYYYSEPLCYSDSAFGSVQHSTKGCNFAGQIFVQGIDNIFEADGFKIYPNPVKTFLTVQTTANENMRIIIRNVMAQEIFRLDSMSTTTDVWLEHLPSGIYQIDLQGENRRYKVKFVKE